MLSYSRRHMTGIGQSAVASRTSSVGNVVDVSSVRSRQWCRILTAIPRWESPTRCSRALLAPILSSRLWPSPPNHHHPRHTTLRAAARSRMSTGSDTDTNTSNGSSLFQSAGGPPLILVCIAGGLLFGAFVGMLLMKRLRPVVVVQRVNAPGDAEVPLREKPQLYDIHLVSALEGRELPPWAHLSVRPILRPC